MTFIVIAFVAAALLLLAGAAAQGQGPAPAPATSVQSDGVSCLDILDSGGSTGDGVYTIDPDGSGGQDPVQVYCDMTTDEGGWTLVGSTRDTTFNDQASIYYADLTTLSPTAGHEGIWEGMRPVAGHATTDIRFSCRDSAYAGPFDVDLAFYDVPWYEEITASHDDAEVCFEEENGVGQTLPPPARRNLLTSESRPLGDQWDAGYLEGEDGCSSVDDFTVDFDDRGMDSNESDGTDWGEDDGGRKCGDSFISGGTWFVWMRERVGVFLSPPLAQGIGTPGSTVVYTGTLQNLTGETDSFTLGVAGAVWTTTLSISNTGPIPQGGAVDFSVQVDVPVGASHGDTDEAIIEATSVNYPARYSDTATVQTFVPGEVAYVALAYDDLVAAVDTASRIVADTVDVGAAGCDFPWRATMAPDGDHVYVACYLSGDIVVIETAGNTVVTTVEGTYRADGIAFTADGQYALVGSRWDAQIAVVDATSHVVSSTIATPSWPRSVAVHPYLDRAYATCGDGTILVVDTNDFSIAGDIPVHGEPWDVAVSSDGRWVFTGDRWGAGLDIIAVGANTVYSTVTGLGTLTGLEVAPDGSRIYASGLDSGVHVIDGATFDHIATVDTAGYAFEAAVTCDGSELFVGDRGSSVPVIDTATSAIATLVPMPGSGARGVAICPQSRLPGLHLYPAADSAYRAAGESVTYVGELVNATGQVDSFDFSLSGNAWPTQLSLLNTGPLPPGGRISFTAQVDIPVGAAPGDMDTVTIQATSVTSPTTHLATADLETVVICSPNLVLSGESELAPFHDDTFNFGGQGLTYIQIHARSSAGRNTMNGAVQAYDRASGVWDTLGTWDGVQPRLVDRYHIPPRYSAVRVDLHDTASGAQVSYDYEFVVCRAAAVALNPLSGQRLSGPGTTLVYTQTVTNYAMTGDSFDLSVSGNSWPTTFWDNATQITNTGPLADRETFTFTVRVRVPPGANVGDADEATITARSTASPAVSDTASLRTSVLSYPWAQAFREMWAPDESTDWEPYLAVVPASGIVTAQMTDDQAYQNSPSAVAAYPRDAVVTAWTSEDRWSGSANYSNIEYATFDGDGDSVIPVTRVSDNVNATMPTYDYNPAPAVDPTDGNVLFAWYRYGGPAWTYNIHYAVRGPAGGEVRAPTAVTTNTTGAVQDLNPSTAAFGDGGFALAWEHNDNGVRDIHYAVLTGRGELIAGPVSLTNNEWEYDYQPRANRLADGNVLLTWHGYHASGSEVYYAVLDSAGTVVHPVTRLTDFPDEASFPDAVGLRSGRTVIAWRQFGYYPGWGRQVAYTVMDDVYLTATLPITTPVILTSTLSNVNDYVSLARDGEDNAVLTWGDDNDDSIYYAVVDGDGAVRSAPLVFLRTRGDGLEVSWWGAGNGSLPPRRVFLPLVLRSLAAGG